MNGKNGRDKYYDWYPEKNFVEMTPFEIICYAGIANKIAHMARSNGDKEVAVFYFNLKTHLVVRGVIHYPHYFRVSEHYRKILVTHPKTDQIKETEIDCDPAIAKKFLPKKGVVELHFPVWTIENHLKDDQFGYDDREVKKIVNRMIAPYNSSIRRKERGRGGRFTHFSTRRMRRIGKQRTCSLAQECRMGI